MSIGNTKDQGNKGNNLPYQLRTVQLLGLISGELEDINNALNPDVVDTTMATDAFGRQRISEPYTLGDYKHIYGLDPDFIDIGANGGNITFQANKACARLQVTSTPFSSIIHQSKIYHQYMPGKSQLIYLTFNMYSAVENCVKRIGYYDTNNGIYFQQNGEGILSFVIRTFTSGSTINNSVNQSDWNKDKCDGTGESGFVLDITKTHILFIDFQWLGVGRVRMGFVHDGAYVIAHEFMHDNVLPVVYMSNPNLPVRAEIIGGGTSPAYMDQICATVLSEGGYIESGQNWSALNNPLRSLAAGASIPIFAIRLSNTFKTLANRMLVRLDNYNIFSTKEPLIYQVVKLPNAAALTGGSWTSVDSDSGVEYNSGPTSYSGGDVIASGYVPASASGKEGIASNANPSAAKKNYIVQNYTSTDSEIYTIFAKNVGTTNTEVGVSMQWREIY